MNHETEIPHGETEQEHSDIDVRGIFRLLVGMVFGLIVVSFVVYWQYVGFERRAKDSAPTPSPFANQKEAPRGPLLEVNEAGSAASFRREQETRITTWSWTDATHTRATIPIDRAMTLVLENGLPRFPAPEPAPDSATPSSPPAAPPHEGTTP